MFYKYYNANPKNKKTDDCVIRAICTALDLPYRTILHELVEVCEASGYSITDVKCYDRLLKKYGFKKQRQPKKPDGTKYTGTEFCRMVKNETILAHIGGHHIVCIQNGTILDIWDSSGGCIGNYWRKE